MLREQIRGKDNTIFTVSMIEKNNKYQLAILDTERIVIIGDYNNKENAKKGFNKCKVFASNLIEKDYNKLRDYFIYNMGGRELCY
ncbi:MAG: hypothetical protein ACRDBY_14300 [Cetobacterium sp.]